MRWLIAVLCGFLFLTMQAEEKLSPKNYPAETFLRIVRNPPGRDSWALMKGYAQHRREGKRPVKAAIEMGIFFTPVRTLAQIRFNGKEIYTIGQSYGKDGSTSVDKKLLPGGREEIRIYGITPEDLAMSFLYWKLEKELTPMSFRGQDCRVFRLISPNGKEHCEVTISCEYFFPLRAQWFIGKDQTPLRELEASAFKKAKDYWFVNRLFLRGKNWVTQIRFDEVDAGPYKGKLPAGVFTE